MEKMKTPSEKRRKIDILREACQEEYGDPPWETYQIIDTSMRLKREKRYPK